MRKLLLLLIRFYQRAISPDPGLLIRPPIV